MLKKLPINQNQDVFQIVIETRDGQIIFMRYLKELPHIQGSGTTEQKSQKSLDDFLYDVIVYNAN